MYSQQPVRCLISDDDAFDLLHAKRNVLKVWPQAKVIEARDVRTTMAYLSSCALDLALLDNDMPDGTSLQAVSEQIGTSDYQRPVMVMISGNDDYRLPRLALQAGFDHFISKHDLCESTLRRAVSNLLRQESVL